jgi:hypothetical protein
VDKVRNGRLVFFSIPEYRVGLSVEGVLGAGTVCWFLFWGLCLVIAVACRGLGYVLVGGDALTMREGIELDLFWHLDEVCERGKYT